MDDIFQLQEEPSQEVEFDFLKALNPEQKKAVMTTQGPVLVLSGAGTGKTRVLTTRIAYIIARKLAHPWEILATTFTNKAAKEMQERLASMIGPAAGSVWLGTFHRIGIKILAKYASLLGFSENFIILGTDDQEKLLKQIMTENGIDVKKYKPSIAVDIISRWKDRALFPTHISALQDSGFADGKMVSIYTLYQHRLKELNAVDFGDLLLLPLTLFKNHPEILAGYQRQFKYILVDEYQDTNTAQYLLLELLAKGHGNICCVGDDDQSIYSWRGAEVTNILNFEKTFPNPCIIRLERNYRSGKHILGAASALIAHNHSRLGKTLRVADESNAEHHKVVVQAFYNGTEEADHVLELIEKEIKKKTPLSEIAILVRASFQTREFEEAFMRFGIPYKIIGGFKFYEREEIKDAIAYLRLVLNTSDDLAFLRIINKPKRGLGPQTITQLTEQAKSFHCSLFDSILKATLKPGAIKTLMAFHQLILSAREKLKEKTVAQMTEFLLNESGYVDMWRTDKSPEAEGRIENLKELCSLLQEFESLNDFISYVSLMMDTDEKTEEEYVSVMTLHASKGLEFKVVFLPGWEEDLFPHEKALDESGEDGLEEERRLAYVGLTRAKQKAFISFAQSRRIYGQWQNSLPSRFIEELSSADVEMENPFMTQANNLRNAFQEVYTSANNYFTSPYSVKKETGSQKLLGKRVYHETFGTGTIIQVQQDRVDVHFDNYGVKKVLARFLELI